MPRKKQNKKNQSFLRFKASPKFEPRPPSQITRGTEHMCPKLPDELFLFFFFFSHESPARRMGWENEETHKIRTGTKITRKQNKGKEMASLRSIVPNKGWAKEFASKKKVFCIFFPLFLFCFTLRTLDGCFQCCRVQG
ncbi:unnamed protein product [Ixodes pacificus]